MGERRVALVTGASRGIGLAIADALSRDHLVIGTATSEAGAAAIADRLADRGRGIVMQLNEAESIESALAELAQAGLVPLILVNNAGITRDNLMLRMKPEEWSEVIDTNLTGLYRLVKPLLRGMMKARWGRIISLSSVVARMGNPGQSNYVASKAGIEGFTRALAQEVGSRGITVNAVAPGFIETDMTAALPEEQVAQMLSRIPVGRMGSAVEVADAVSFLASENSGYITGTTLQINGGLHMS
ncbi:MAG: 3-oxoacyl-ACP reductase FabG [Pseudomonadales bacterium]